MQASENARPLRPRPVNKEKLNNEYEHPTRNIERRTCLPAWQALKIRQRVHYLRYSIFGVPCLTAGRLVQY